MSERLSPGKIEHRCTEALAEIEAAWDQMLTPASVVMGSKGGGVLLDDDDESSADTPAHIVAIDVRREVGEMLNGWCRVVVDDNDVEHGIPDGVNVPAMCVFLRRWALLMSTHEAAYDMLDEVVTCARKVRHIVNPPRHTSIKLGPCPLTWQDPDTAEDRPCTGTVRTSSKVSDQTEATCTACGTSAVAKYWEDRMLDTSDTAPLTAADAVPWLHRHYGKVVQRATIRQWVSRDALRAIPREDGDHGPDRYERAALAYACERDARMEMLNSAS